MPMSPPLFSQEPLSPLPSPSQQSATEQDTANSSQVKAKLATILAVIARQAQAVGNGVPNEYVQAMEGVRDLEAFAAVLYSSNFEFETLESGSENSAAAAAAAASRGVGVEVKTLNTEAMVEGGISRIMEDEGGVRAGGGAYIAATTGMFDNVWGKVTGRAWGSMLE